MPARSHRARFDGAQRGDVLARLGAGEDAGRADPLEQAIDVQRILVHEEAAEHADQADAPLDGIGTFPVSDHSLIGVDPHVQLVAVCHDLGSAHVGDLETRPPVR